MKSLISLFYSLILFFIFSPNIHADTNQRKITGSDGNKVLLEYVETFNEPWAMTFLPNGHLLVTEKSGSLILFDLQASTKRFVENVPEVAYGGQGGLGDVILHPDFQKNRWIYLSYAEKGSLGKKGAVVIRAELKSASNTLSLQNIKLIWRQTPKVFGSGHYSHRLAFGPDGKLYIASGERQKQSPAQSWKKALGKIIRLNEDGSIPPDNPFQNKGELAKTFWTTGHRNILGIAFDKTGQLWIHEMGPRHGDEFNRIVAGDNYGWPIVSWGDHYSGISIPDHDTRPEFHSPEVYWVPTIAPSGLIIYQGKIFPDWQNVAFIGGLRSESLILVKIEGKEAREVERFDMGKRIREVEQGPQGAIWLLEDRNGGRLIRLSPAN